MHSLAQITQDQDYSHSYRAKVKKPSIAIVKEALSTKEADQVIESVSDLITHPDYKPFFYSRLYATSKSWFLEQAHKARKYGKNPPQFFVHLLK